MFFFIFCEKQLLNFFLNDGISVFQHFVVGITVRLNESDRE